jgi:transcriptional regulator GlxA family with amidase domain
LCTAAHTLGAAGLLNNKRCAIHWENLPGFQEAFPQVSVYSDLFEIDGNIYTCAGGTAALDMMLSIISDDFDDNTVNRICETGPDRPRAQSDRSPAAAIARPPWRAKSPRS